MQVHTVVEEAVAEENTYSRPLRGELRHGFKDHLGYFKTRDDHLNLLDRVVVVFYCRDIYPVHANNDGREENRSGDDGQNLNRYRERFERGVGRLSADPVNDVSKLKDAAEPYPQAGQDIKTRRFRP